MQSAKSEHKFFITSTASAEVGLGFLINLARGVLDTPLMFVAVFSLVMIAQALYLLVALFERTYLKWQN